MVLNSAEQETVNQALWDYGEGLSANELREGGLWGGGEKGQKGGGGEVWWIPWVESTFTILLLTTFFPGDLLPMAKQMPFLFSLQWASYNYLLTVWLNTEVNTLTPSPPTSLGQVSSWR